MTKKKDLKLYARLKYHNPSSNATVKIRQLLLSPEDATGAIAEFYSAQGDPPTRLPSLDIKFDLHTHQKYWSSPDQLEHQHSRTSSTRFHLFYAPSTSYSTFLFEVMQEKTENWGEEFDKNYRQLVIHDMIGKVSEIVDGECNKDRTIHLDVCVRVKSVVHHSSSILGLVKNMEVDEDVVNGNCMICVEKLGELMCMPCSHLFHEDCITTWLENGNSCPV